MRIAVLLCCLAFGFADQNLAKRGIGPEAFAKPHSQDSGSLFNLQNVLQNNQLPQQVFGAQYGYQVPYFGSGASHIPPQVAPHQKPEQLALAAAAAVAQQNFGDPAYGAPPPQQPQNNLQILSNPPYSQLPQYREYTQQLQNYVSQPIALNYGNRQVNVYPPPPPQPQPALNYGNAPVRAYRPLAQPQPQLPISTFQAYGQGQPIQPHYYSSARDLFQPAPPQVAPEAPQPAPVVYATPQPPLAVQYAAPQPVAVQYAAPSYGLQSGKGGSYSYSSFASGDQLTTSSGFRPIHP